MNYSWLIKGLGTVVVVNTAGMPAVAAAEGGEFLWSQDGPIVSCQQVGTGGNGGRTYTFDDTTYEVIDPDERDELISKAATACTTLWTDMHALFYERHDFNEPIGHWDMSNVAATNTMFAYAVSFDQDISHWDVSAVEDMEDMFFATNFNHPIGDWDVAQVSSMAGMFAQSTFNQDIGDWQTDSLETMGGMFAGNIVFNQDIGQWNTHKVWSMGYLFHDAQAFDQDISGWDTSHALEMMHMFDGARAFNQDLSSWRVEQVRDHADFAPGTDSWTLPKPEFTQALDPQLDLEHDLAQE